MSVTVKKLSGAVAGTKSSTEREQSHAMGASASQAYEALAAEAAERILADLINALLAEGLTEVEGRGELIGLTDARQDAVVAALWPDGLNALSDEASPEPGSVRPEVKLYRWRADRESGHCIVFQVRPGFVQTNRYIAGSGVYEVGGVSPVRLDAAEVLRRLTDALYNGKNPGRTAPDGSTGVTRLHDLLQLSLEQAQWSARLAEDEAAELQHGGHTGDPWSFVLLERLAAWRDRPFHPVAKAKGGWTEADYRAYSAESGQPVKLQWLAVKREYLLHGSGNAERGASFGPADLLLTADERAGIDEAMKKLGLSPEEYTALPAHPWQLEAVLPKMLPHELDSGIYIPLGVEAGNYVSTSSARSLAPLDGGAQHVKLPLGIVSLGAVRYLPAVHMMNSERGQRLLEQARERDQVLKEHLSLCDETNWWAYVPENGDLFADPPRHLSALVRGYPPHLIGREDTRLIPMSALSVLRPIGAHHIFDDWMRLRSFPETAESAILLFREVCVQFGQIVLRLFRLGVVPEIHGQNVLLVLREGKLAGMLLRDHDSARLHLPWMQMHGLDDPCYKMKPGYPNSLYNETPQKLLFYIQTLGIQVNLYSILETVSHRYGIAELRLGVELKESLLEAIELADLPVTVRELTEDALFRQPSWPWKNLLKPLLEQEGAVSGSMPSGAGMSVNPFAGLN
ncbi:IucA/IucC family protein [Paenibacillus sp. NPDC056579]|uniref:IucA/IucC family protein n=1 Tax=Paenibacillus sp. NPDC056579 TaxID=3345871 RepID=UPI0036BDA6DA